MQFQRTPWKHDPRSKAFSHQKFFGAAPLQNLPPTLGRPLRWIMYQGNTLRCTGYSGAADGSYIHGRRFSGDWQAAKVGEIQGRSVDISGGDPNAAMKSERDYGFLPADLAPISLEVDGVEGSNMEAWRRYNHLDAAATQFDNIPGFVRVDGPYDTFDNIKNALYLAYNNDTITGPTVRAFGRWYHDWSFARDGIIPTTTQSFAGYHAYNFVDWTTIDGVEYLIIHNSYGSLAGKHGFFYMPREVVNREFAQWGTSLKIVKTLKQEWIEEARKETPIGRLWRAFIDIWYAVSERFGTLHAYGGETVESLLIQLLHKLIALREALTPRQTPQNAPQPTPVPKPTPTPPPPHKDRLEDLCAAIRDYEGKPGDRNYKNNNPGNCRYSSVGYASIYGHVGRDPQNFAVFATYELGWLYLKNLIRSKFREHPQWTLFDYINEHAPASDGNNPRLYAQYVAKRLGVPVDTPLRTLLA